MVSLTAHAAEQRVYKAIRRGELVRSNRCEECGRGGFIEAAHENYDERLEVRWLCRPCHRKWDYEDPKDLGDGTIRPDFNLTRIVEQFTCHWCGKQFWEVPHNRRHTNAPCCGHKCAAKLHRARRRATLQAAGIGVYVCARCGKRIERTPGKVRTALVFCNRSCAMTYYHRGSA
jgi:DNA-directed RNA polymerase subunit RPC12/RpoP